MYLKSTKKLLEKSAREAKNYHYICAQIKDKLFNLQLKTGKKQYEKQKDLWAEMHARLYYEISVMEKLVNPKMKKHFNVDMDFELKRKIKLDFTKLFKINDEKKLNHLYTIIYNRSLKRVYRLKEETEKYIFLAKHKKDKKLQEDLESALKLINKKAIPCFEGGYKHYYAFFKKEIKYDLSHKFKHLKFKNIRDAYVKRYF